MTRLTWTPEILVNLIAVEIDMSAEIKNCSQLVIDNESMISVLRDWFDSSYGPFSESQVEDVIQLDNGTFQIDFEPKPTKTEGK